MLIDLYADTRESIYLGKKIVISKFNPSCDRLFTVAFYMSDQCNRVLPLVGYGEGLAGQPVVCWVASSPLRMDWEVQPTPGSYGIEAGLPRPDSVYQHTFSAYRKRAIIAL